MDRHDMALGTLGAFWAVSLLFVIIPGADWAYAMSAGMLDGAVVPAVGGLLSGHFVAIVLVTAGVGALIASTPGALTAISLAGAGYLVWLALCTLANPPTPSADAQRETGGKLMWFARGAGVSGLNPKVTLLILALLPQFIHHASPWTVPEQVMVLGGVHLLNCGAVYLLVGFGSQTVLRSRPRVARAVGRVSGMAMIAIAAALLVERLIR
jgi:threonine/homoserine/homoserine lactone efflux protein